MAPAIDLNDYPEVIDMTVFEQILEMDDDPDDREFSREIFVGFMTQADQTFTEMDQHVEDMKLKQLSELGHFLKGSSSTLGLVKMQRSCEKIQNYGKGLDATGSNVFPNPPNTRESVKYISACIRDAKKEFVEAKTVLKEFFGLPEDE